MCKSRPFQLLNYSVSMYLLSVYYVLLTKPGTEETMKKETSMVFALGLVLTVGECDTCKETYLK